jgi:hypothetical protein
MITVLSGLEVAVEVSALGSGGEEAVCSSAGTLKY